MIEVRTSRGSERPSPRSGASLLSFAGASLDADAVDGSFLDADAIEGSFPIASARNSTSSSDEKRPGQDGMPVEGSVLNLRTTTAQKCDAVPRRARI